MSGRIQGSRSELKYVVSQAAALEVRSFVRCFLSLDEHGAGQADFSYPAHSRIRPGEIVDLWIRPLNANSETDRIP